MKQGNAPAHLYSDDGTRLQGIQSPDGKICPVTVSYPTTAALLADQQAGNLADGVYVVGDLVLPYDSKNPPLRSQSFKNYATKFLPVYSQARNNLAKGLGSVNIGIIGDSLSVGQYALPAAGANYYSGGTAPYALSALVAATIGGNNDNFWGGVQKTENSIAALLAYDSRVTQGATGTDWQTYQLNAKTIGTAFDFVTGTSKTLTFSPVNAWDSVDIYYIKNTTYGTTAVSGAVTGTVNSAGTLGAAVQTLTKSLGTGSITLTATNENHIVGVNFYTTSKAQTNVLRLGCGNSTSTDWVGATGWQSLDFLNLIKATNPCHLWVIQLGANDVIGAVAVATYISNMQTLITALKSSTTNPNGGDIVLMTTPPINGVSAANNALYRQAVFDLANSNGLLVIDNYADFVSFANGNANGWYSSANNVHQSAAGYQEVVRSMFNSGVLI